MAYQSSADSHAQPLQPPGTTIPTVSMGALETKFDKLLALMETQIVATREQTSTIEKELKDHGEKLEILRKDAVKNDQPFEPRELEDQQTWGAMNKEAVAMTKEAVGEWTTLMNVSLVFNAIFLAIVTAFIVPVLQALQQVPASDTSADDQGVSSGLFDPHRQEVIQQWIALFQVSAFALSIFNSALCVLGTQWGARLIARIKAEDNHESTIQFERRKAIGKKWLLRLSGLLFSTLLLSIILFMVAFLLQAWVVAYAHPQPRPVLIVAAAIVTAMVFTILIIVTVTTYHAVRRDNSPFETPLSNVIRLLLSSGGEHGGSSQRTEDILEVTSDDEKDVSYWTGSDYGFTVETLKVFASVVINAPEAEVLEKVVPSFRFGPWIETGDHLFPLFKAVFDRFMATDTSIRVRETLGNELTSSWDLLADEEPMNFKDTRIGRWYSRRCHELCDQSAEAHAKYFGLFTEVASVREGNTDLREIAQLPYKECMGRVLASYDREGKVGYREDIFGSAIGGCISLLQAGKENDVREIISDCHSSIIKSFMRSAREWRIVDEDVLRSFILQGCAPAILTDISEFLSDPFLVAHSPNYDIVAVLVPLLPPDFTLTSHLDLSYVLAAVCRMGQLLWSNWEDFTDATLFLLDHGAFDMLSDISSAYTFLKQSLKSVDISSPSHQRVRSFLDRHAERFTGCLELSDDAHATLVADLSIFARELDSSDPNFRIKKFMIALNRYYAILLGDNSRPLSQDDSLLILKSIIRNPFAKWRDLERFVSRFEWTNAAIWRAISRAENLVDVGYVDDDLLPLRLLGYLKERDFVLPSDSDLSQLLACITRCEPRESFTWEVHSDTLMHYIAQGDAFRRLTDRDSARKFFTLCTKEPDDYITDYRHFTTDETRRQAKEYLKQMDSVNDRTASFRVMKYWHMTRATITKLLGHKPSVDQMSDSVGASPVPHRAIEMENISPTGENPVQQDTGVDPDPPSAAPTVDAHHTPA
ncbi:hypothetical protein SISNIDRAFT_225864 [Sistotremastrum niveocremeum HHB9708]|uniref:DUF6535 domain-containing protein n=2 Tax=Sistotremastraceae TaxID=3402574 RepID=A0A164QAG6_9AGAM|nr:hypothetical protein SISNIDRAFT_225864 [Sistotremastrum niveocremeum HHB9708]KZT33073.1 hypothetical protein SISSUDRAFT_445006 [Sistotremastrum suecicum HHB10207 ss-3]